MLIFLGNLLIPDETPSQIFLISGFYTIHLMCDAGAIKKITLVSPAQPQGELLAFHSMHTVSNKTEGEDGTPPWNFSWVVRDQLAAMGWPQSKANLEFLISKGIKHLITLSPEMLPPVEKVPRMNWIKIPVEEFEAPTLDQIIQCMQICEKCLSKNEPIGIHCRQGRGRTGVMAACFLVRFHDLTPGRAITNLRIQRPGSVETPEQERIVCKYYDHLRRSE